MKIGIIGAGGAAQGIHIPGFRLIPEVEIATICDSNGKHDVQDYREVLSRKDIDAVVIATPNYTHPEIVREAFAAGKHVLCEKPLALNASDAQTMLDAAAASGKVHMTAFTYRYTPAVQYMKRLIDDGALGSIRTVRAAYLMALSTHLLGWRSEKKFAGSGVLADIGSHLIHLVQFLMGDITALTALDRRFRNDPTSDVEDWIGFLAELANGACGTFEISRVCAGRGAGITEDIFIEVYGTGGSTVFSLQDPWGLQVAIGEDGRDPARPLTRIGVPAEFLKLAGSPRDIHAADKRWGYRFDQAYQFHESVKLGVSRAPSLADGVRCQKVLDAALRSSASRSWVTI
jgi:predicted dehydrogenase